MPLRAGAQTLGVKLVSYLAGAAVSVFVARALGPHAANPNEEAG